MTTNHLTDEQFSDLLAGDNAPEAAMLHLEQCEHCATELAELRSAMGSFKEMSMSWAEVEAPRKVHVPSRWEIRRRALPAWSFAAAMVVAVAAVGINHQLSMRQTDEVADNSTVSVPASRSVAEDDRLLMSIDHELSYQVRPSVSVTDLRVSGNTSKRVAN